MRVQQAALLKLGHSDRRARGSDQPAGHTSAPGDCPRSTRRAGLLSPTPLRGPSRRPHLVAGKPIIKNALYGPGRCRALTRGDPRLADSHKARSVTLSLSASGQLPWLPPDDIERMSVLGPATILRPIMLRHRKLGTRAIAANARLMRSPSCACIEDRETLPTTDAQSGLERASNCSSASLARQPYIEAGPPPIIIATPMASRIS